MSFIIAFFRNIYIWFYNKIHSQLTGFDEYLKEQLQNPSFAKTYNEAKSNLQANPSGLKSISIDEVDRYFGQLATIILTCDRHMLGTEYIPSKSEFTWFIDQSDNLSAHWKNEVFFYFQNEWYQELNETDFIEQNTTKSI
jgi:hypothetical protein